MLFRDTFFSRLYTDLINKSNLDNLWIQVTITAVKVFLQVLLQVTKHTDLTRLVQAARSLETVNDDAGTCSYLIAELKH